MFYYPKWMELFGLWTGQTYGVHLLFLPDLYLDECWRRHLSPTSRFEFVFYNTAYPEPDCSFNLYILIHNLHNLVSINKHKKRWTSIVGWYFACECGFTVSILIFFESWLEILILVEVYLILDSNSINNSNFNSKYYIYINAFNESYSYWFQQSKLKSKIIKCFEIWEKVVWDICLVNTV